ncbi:hypothetical protein [Brooklawnia cerclae]|uniref:Uncharacterized protein n=1 Tax=Brooklawnia cerclae TaxID=349934 RepID=A0ABX0SDN9_9ACTN|nr:hypothetical protein [Brooklawnia cerclae]NIH56469.1 hypothetical protein [Brooklawnia cerclae]
MRQLFSNLNLNGDTPVRVQPRLGEWGPRRVPSTTQKKRARLWVAGAFCGAVTALFLLGNFFYKLLMGIS